jgi:hypothetical protein
MILRAVPKVIHMHRRIVAAPLLVAAMLGGGCASGSAAEPPRDDIQRQAPPRPPGQAPPPAVSSRESLRVIDEYVAKHNRAVTDTDGRAWRGLLGEPLAATAGALLRIGAGDPPERETITLVNPVLLVPRLDAYPRWFVAAAMERRGRRGTPRPALMMFTRSGPDAAWRLANKTTITGQKLPKIATDGQGYALTVPAETSARLAVGLNDLAAAHGAYLTGGDDRGFAAGPYTSGWRAQQAETSRRLRAGGWRDTGRFSRTRYPVAALRTKDGGVLAWYAISRVDTLVAADGGAPDPRAVPSDVRGYLDRPVTGGRTEVRAAWLLLPLTYVPPTGQASVLGMTSGLTSATVIEH